MQSRRIELVQVLSVPEILPGQRRSKEHKSSAVAVSLIHSTDFIHILLRQLKVEHLRVHQNTTRVCGLGNADGSTLNSPTDHYLSTTLSVLLSELHQNGILHQRHSLRVFHILSSSQREVGSAIDIVLLAVLNQLPLLKVRVELHLVHSRLDLAELKQITQLLGREVGDTDGTHQTLPMKRYNAKYTLSTNSSIFAQVNFIFSTS